MREKREIVPGSFGMRGHSTLHDKEFIRFDKKSGEVLKVDNYRNGRSAKFEGECF